MTTINPSPPSAWDSAGVVWTRRRAVVACEKCGGLYLDYGGGHAAERWAVRDGRHVKVDCVGKEVRCG